MKNLIVDNKFNKKTLSYYLLHKFPSLSINSIYKALRKKDIVLNGVRIKNDIILNCGDHITIYISDNVLNNSNFSIIYEDDNILIIDKPYKIDIPSLASNMKEQLKYSFIEPCHRLDLNTCGIVLFAKNKISLETCLRKFKNQRFEKHYHCVVYGIPKNNFGNLSDFLFKDSKKGIVYISNIKKKGYVPIKTIYNVICNNIQKNISLLDVQIPTR